jgi:hypothetical protein
VAGTLGIIIEMDNFTKEFVDREIEYLEELRAQLPAGQTEFVAPPFDGKTKQPIQRYYWWSWHPAYPYWSKSCWGGATEAEAMADIEKPTACGMDVYHNKLIREDEHGVLVEVADRPCKQPEVWRKLAEKVRAKRIQ